MISRPTFAALAAFLLLLAPANVFQAQPTPSIAPQGTSAASDSTPSALPLLSPIFADNMVLQRGKPNTFWGWAEPGETVKVEIGAATASGVAGPDRRWQAKIQPPEAGGPYTVKITGHEIIELHNVLVGDVWLCGGQSNMGLPLHFATNGAEEAKTANFPQIRYFNVAGHTAYHHTDLVSGKWSEISPQNAEWVSATAFFFARKVYQETKIPIGLVLDNMGGTPAEAWTSAEALRPLKDFDAQIAEVQRLAAAGAPEYGNFVMHWYDEFDLGLKGKWAAPELDDSAWKPVDVPGGFAELGVPTTPALVWFRKEITLPDPLPAGRTRLLLGSIERMDTAYINGTEIGASAWVENPRAYFVRPGLLKPGRNIIAIRVLKTKPEGGFLSKAEDLRLELGDKTSIPLAGKWKAQLSVDGRSPQPLPLAYENWPVMPTVLYEGMLKPIAPLSIAGALWYQGEQNSPRGFQYRKLLPAMIADWRKLFDQGDFPFYIVGLPAFTPRSATPVEGDAWTELREAQAMTAASVPNTCLAVTIDTGDPANIHSPQKQPVGERLALCALANYYNQKVVFAGPTATSFDRSQGAIRIHFAHTDGGLVVKGDKLGEFSLAGADHKWAWADARIEGDTVVVSSAAVPNPIEVRYAWQSNPAATLFNGAGLPAVPFRSDNWPGVTEPQRLTHFITLGSGESDDRLQKRVLHADLAKITGPHSQVPLLVVGAGRAEEGLRADWQQQLATVQSEIGFRYLRMHGLLCDEMGVYNEDKQGNPEYNFQYIDTLYDALLKLHIRPFVELGFMPTKLANGTTTIFWWKGNTSMPKDYAKWNGLIRALIAHWRERYGVDEVNQWYFEVWNEPDIPGFFPHPLEDYFKLYKNTSESIRAECAKCRIGGPASAIPYAAEQAFEKWIIANPEPIDFIAAHAYGVNQGFLDVDGSAGTIIDPDPDSVSGRMRHSRELLQGTPLSKLELHFTEWSSAYTPTDYMHDQYHQASFILDKVKRATPYVDSMSYWTFTDIFEENGPRFTPFHGGFGMINLEGIKKPSFHAFKFLSRLNGDDIASDDAQSWITKSKDGAITVLTWDYSPVVPPAGKTDQVFYKQDLPANPKGDLTIDLANVPNGKYHLAVYQTGYKQNDPFTAYAQMGQPKQLTIAQVEALKKISTGEPLSQSEVVVSGGHFTKTLPLRTNDCYELVLTRK